MLMASVAMVVTTYASSSFACGESGQPWVSVAFSEGSWSERLEQDALEDLKAGLATRHIETCAQGQGPERPPVAAIIISSGSSESVQVTVEIRDAVTEKRVSRDVDLSSMPPDGRALAIAVAADELVWASWAEIGYRGTKRRTKAPPQVVVAVEQNLQPPPTAVRVGAQLAAEHFAAGLTQIGADALCALPLAQRLRLKIAAGARQGLSVHAPDGRVESTATAAALDVGLLLLKSQRTELSWTLGSRFAWIHLQGEGDAGALGNSLNGLTVYARTGLGAALHLGSSMWLEFGAGAGLPLRAIEANDSGRRITGVSGLEQSAFLSLQGDL